VILEELKSFIHDNDLQDSKIAIACSGGVDSLALLDMVLKSHSAELILCLHLDHGWHASSKEASALLETYCKANGINFYSKVYAPGEMQKTESEARKLRYEFFEEECKKHNVSSLFLAHNLNDNVETVLFRLFRGTGSSGLRGIAHTRDLGSVKIYRPFLQLRRDEIEVYAKTQSLEYFEDSSNADVTYARNRIRHNVLPEALKINPKALKNIDQLTKLIYEEQSFLSKELEKVLEKLGDLPWSLEEFRGLEPVMQRKALEASFCTNIEFVNDFMAAVAEGGFHRVNFKKEKFFTIKQKMIHLEYSSVIS